MDVRLHTDHDAFARLAEPWNALLGQSENTSVFSRHEYLSKWVKYFCTGQQLFVVEFLDDGQTVGYAPLMFRDAEARGQRDLCVLGHFADYCGLVVRPGHEEPVAATLLDLILEQKVASLTLDHFREESAVFGALAEGARERHLLLRPLAVTRAPYIEVQGTWEEFIRQRSRNTYRDIRKKLNRLSGISGLEVRTIRRQEEYREHVRRMLEMHLRLWASRGQPTPYQLIQRRLFLQELGLAMLEQGLLRFTSLQLEGRAVAYLWCYDHKGVRHYLNAAWDTEHASLSPGSLLLLNDLRDAFQGGMAEYDMLGGEEPYKYRYATGRRYVTTLLFDDLDRPRRQIRPLRPAPPVISAGPAKNDDAPRSNLLITAHPDDEAIFFGALLRRDPQHLWTCCLVTRPMSSPRICEHRLAEFNRSCTLLGMEPVLLDLEEPSGGCSLDAQAVAARLAARFSGRRFDEIYSHGAFGEYGNADHAAVSLAARETFDTVWSLAGPLAAEAILGEEPDGRFPDKREYFWNVHHSQVFLADLVASEERYVRLTLEQARLIHRVFFQLTDREDWVPALTTVERDQAGELFAPLFDAYFSRRCCPAELANAVGSNRIDVITPVQLLIIRTAAGLVAAGGGGALARFVRQLAGHPEAVARGAAVAAEKLITLLDRPAG